MTKFLTLNKVAINKEDIIMIKRGSTKKSILYKIYLTKGYTVIAERFDDFKIVSDYIKENS